MLTNLFEGKNVIVIPNEKAKDRMQNLLFEDVYSKFMERREGVNSFTFTYNHIVNGNFSKIILLFFLIINLIFFKF